MLASDKIMDYDNTIISRWSLQIIDGMLREHFSKRNQGFSHRGRVGSINDHRLENL